MGVMMIRKRSNERIEVKVGLIILVMWESGYKFKAQAQQHGKHEI